MLSTLYFMALLVITVQDDVESVTGRSLPFMPKTGREVHDAKLYSREVTTHLDLSIAVLEDGMSSEENLQERAELLQDQKTIQKEGKNVENNNGERNHHENYAQKKETQESRNVALSENKNLISKRRQNVKFADTKTDGIKDNDNQEINQPSLDQNKHSFDDAVKHNIEREKPKPFLRYRFAVRPPGPKPVEKELSVETETAQKPSEAALREYYTLRETRINAFDFRFREPGHYICKENERVFLVILCLTTYYDIETRETIRETWGSVAKTERWPAIDGHVKGVKLVFLLGNPLGHAVKNAIIRDESERYGDVVVADFTDSYYNLTYKVMMGLKWTRDYCNQTSYIVKVDQDMFLHVVNLIRFLRTRHYAENGEVIGYRNTIPKVLRTGVWGVPWEVFPFTRFPNYTNGNCYVISGQAVPKMFEAAERMPYLFIEDAFLTGKCSLM